MENIIQNQTKKVSTGAVVLPIVGLQVFVAVILFFFMELTVASFNMSEYIRLINAIVYAIVLFPEFWFYIPRKAFSFIKIGLTARILPYIVWGYLVFDSLLGHYELMNL